ncbi:MAG: tyrosine-type recombinase/integrase, partial [Planctomycetaceae bacterium]|nr:tyrosine-type recombinase/integrase [Planctomycetaceae bacterium]
MASVFKRKADRGKRNAVYWIQYFDHNGKRRTKKGFTDKQLSEQLASKLENDAHQQRTGLVDPQQFRLAEHRRVLMADHLTDYEAGLRRRDTTAKHVILTMTRVRRVMEGCGFATIGDIEAEPVETLLAKIRAEEDIGLRTYNHYVQAVDGFCRWLVKNQRLVTNPLATLPRLNALVDVRHKRRALSPDEFSRLVTAARTSRKRLQCFTGEQRARIYTLSYMTGLRRKEIASLTPASFDLDSATPTVTVQAACSKHRRTDVLPLHPELVVLLRKWLKGAV